MILRSRGQGNRGSELDVVITKAVARQSSGSSGQKIIINVTWISRRLPQFESIGVRGGTWIDPKRGA